MAVVLGAFADYYKYLFIEFQVWVTYSRLWKLITPAVSCILSYSLTTLAMSANTSRIGPFVDALVDPLTINYPLLGSPIPVAIIVLVYNKFVLTWGPKYMKNRKPFNLAWIMMIYNAFQVLLNLYLTMAGSVTIMHPEFSLKCQPLSYADTPFRRRITWLGYLYFLTKISDLLDTVFFVLRNKSSHISFLHVYHHSLMVIGCYIYCKFASGSHGVLLGVINSFIHSIMYGYYFATIFNSEIKTSLRVKKHITQLQMAQFAILVVHFVIPIFMEDCNAPGITLFAGTIQNLFMFALFSDFYIKTYLKKKPKELANTSDT